MPVPDHELRFPVETGEKVHERFGGKTGHMIIRDGQDLVGPRLQHCIRTGAGVRYPPAEVKL